MNKLENMNKSANKNRELTDTELDLVVGAKQKHDGSAGGNVAAKWNLAQGAAAWSREMSAVVGVLAEHYGTVPLFCEPSSPKSEAG